MGQGLCGPISSCQPLWEVETSIIGILLMRNPLREVKNLPKFSWGTSDQSGIEPGSGSKGEMDSSRQMVLPFLPSLAVRVLLASKS